MAADGSNAGIAGIDTAARLALCLRAAEIAKARAYLLTEEQRCELIGSAWLLTTPEAVASRIDRRERARVAPRDDLDPAVLARVVINHMDVARWRHQDALDSVHEQVSLLADGTIPIWARSDDPEDTDETPLAVALAIEATAIRRAQKRVALRVKQRAWAAKTRAKAKAAMAVAQGGAA